MSTLLVGYDLNKPGQDYDDLFKALQATGTWWHNLDSTWLIKSDETHRELRDRLSELIDENDRLLVIDVSGDSAAWQGFTKKAGQWIKDNL
jgi:hypothetical protein